MSADDEDLRLTIYRSFAETGRAADPPTDASTHAALHRLAEARHIVRDADDRWLSGPFRGLAD